MKEYESSSQEGITKVKLYLLKLLGYAFRIWCRLDKTKARRDLLHLIHGDHAKYRKWIANTTENLLPICL